VLVLIITGLLMQIAFVGMASLHDLRQHTISFLWLYALACLGYGIAVRWSLRGTGPRATLALILGLAVSFRLTLLFSAPPTLSDDVHRYIWDGRLTNAGVNPYAHAVASPLLDQFDSPQRALVNNNWMASPYLPAAQVMFASVYRLAPNSPLAFQIAAVIFDLLTGLLVSDLLRRLGLPRARALIYLWNPLVIVEFSHGAHVDALMICLMMLALWALIAARSTLLSAVALAAATLTKGLPALLLPVVARRWGWQRTLVYGGLVVAACLPVALQAGWGLTGSQNGTGLFGALRIYTSYWNYNSGIYHWLIVGLSGCWTPGVAPSKVVGWEPIWAAKLIVTLALGLALTVVWRKSQEHDDDLALLRLALLPLAAYLLLATTVHPWYVTLVVPLLPFLAPQKAALALLYFSASVALSYLTYLDPANLREYDLVRLLEYVPLYLLLIWSARPASDGAD
jgi:alpha-1,6-mannosyltransferase